jgi:hypothetical protein
LSRFFLLNPTRGIFILKLQTGEVFWREFLLKKQTKPFPGGGHICKVNTFSTPIAPPIILAVAIIGTAILMGAPILIGHLRLRRLSLIGVGREGRQTGVH